MATSTTGGSKFPGVADGGDTSSSSLTDILGDRASEDERTIELADGLGRVTLVDCTPRMVPEGRGIDFRAVQAARVSYGRGLKDKASDEALTRYLLRNGHTSPFEFCGFTVRIEVPLFVARQLMRHRTFSFNEYSGRYAEMPKDFYEPTTWRLQDTSAGGNAQGSAGPGGEPSPLVVTDCQNPDNLTGHQLASKVLEGVIGITTAAYDRLLALGIAKEMARMVLPLAQMTTLYAGNDLHNWFHFLKLRLDEHAQYEIRVLAQAIYDLCEPLAPVAFQAWSDFDKGALKISAPAQEAIAAQSPTLLGSTSRSEGRAYTETLSRLGLNFDDGD